MGFARAIGMLPVFMLRDNFDEVSIFLNKIVINLNMIWMRGLGIGTISITFLISFFVFLLFLYLFLYCKQTR